MTGIGAGLLHRLREVLLNSGQFNSDADIRVLFRTDARLAQWRHQIPEATTPAHRVNRIIGTLFNAQDEAQQNALVLLLYALADLTPEHDARRTEMLGLAHELERSDSAVQLAIAIKAQKLDKTGLVFPLWLKVLLPISLLTLGLIMFLVITHPGARPPQNSYPIPNPNRLQPLGDPDLHIRKLALAFEHDTVVGLWIAVGTNEPEITTLYWLSYPWENHKTLEQHHETPGELMDMTIDCKGNVWLALADPSGVRVYNPMSGVETLLLDVDTTGGWLQKNTVYALASRCRENGDVEVWLGREGVHTLRYAQAYPSLDNVILTPWEDDPVYALTQVLTNIRALHYDRANQTLWGMNGSQPLLFQFPFSSLRTPDVLRLNQPALWALSGGGSDEGSVWVMGEGGLSHVRPDGSQTEQLSHYASTLAVAPDGQSVWMGHYCPEGASDTCWPLAWYHQGMDFPAEIALPNRKEVRSLLIDKQGIVWIGTDKGLIYYTAKK